ncbi:curli production assembly protein CsgG [Methylobacterium terrae]|uniref:Curli production assembly protein CsgG n=1 Tax=Methylobacterium terrae TaxID=2202827 RepID=A0A2U8WRA1_9HYPH|nr:CsgG/HfaB family protein [Methylobacterium terrae]AWN48627.1 curli production assembly protein CsgG [Methylobacterium terrae]
MRRMRGLALGLSLLGLPAGLGACARYDYTGSLGIRPAVGTLTNTGQELATLPPAPAAPLNVAVYDFQDLTGQNKSSVRVGFPEFSRAITQGASAILVDALKTAGQGCWFNVVERGYLDSLLRERKLIQDTYAFLKRDPKDLIDPLRFAEYIVTGGVVSYDSPTQAASGSVLFGGYGGGLNQSKDLVTVNLRLVRVRDGVVVTSINASRPIVTAGANASVTRVLGRRILDAQVAASFQEAVQTAVREAIEASVYELVRQGSARGIWMRKVPASPTPAPDKTPTARAPRKPDDAPRRGETAPAPIRTGTLAPAGRLAELRRSDVASPAVN